MGVRTLPGRLRGRRPALDLADPRPVRPRRLRRAGRAARRGGAGRRRPLLAAERDGTPDRRRRVRGLRGAGLREDGLQLRGARAAPGGGTLLTTETRIHGHRRGGTPQLRRYWLVIEPGSARSGAPGCGRSASGPSAARRRERGQRLQQPVDLVLGRVVEEAGAHGAAAAVEAERAHRLECVVVAVPDVEVLLAEQLGHLAGRAAVDVEAEGRRAALGSADPVELDAVRQPAQEARREAASRAPRSARTPRRGRRRPGRAGSRSRPWRRRSPRATACRPRSGGRAGPPPPGARGRRAATRRGPAGSPRCRGAGRRTCTASRAPRRGRARARAAAGAARGARRRPRRARPRGAPRRRSAPRPGSSRPRSRRA